MDEISIIINDIKLTEDETSTFICALNFFALEMSNDYALGNGFNEQVMVLFYRENITKLKMRL